MKNQVKVKKTDTHTTSQGNHIVCEGKLYIIPCKDGGNHLNMDEYGGWCNPIIVSETEAIKDEDKILHKGAILTVSKNRGHYLSTYEYTHIDIRTDHCFKVLAFPENFSQKQLQAISDGKLKDGMEVLVECSVKYREEWAGSNEDGEPFMMEFFSVKLNQQNHIKLFGVTTRDNNLSDRLFQLANDFASAKKGDIAVKLHSIHNTL